ARGRRGGRTSRRRRLAAGASCERGLQALDGLAQPFGRNAGRLARRSLCEAVDLDLPTVRDAKRAEPHHPIGPPDSGGQEGDGRVECDTGRARVPACLVLLPKSLLPPGPLREHHHDVPGTTEVDGALDRLLVPTPAVDAKRSARSQDRAEGEPEE